MNNLIEQEIKIENMIYEIRGKQLMLDSDVAHLFGYETKQLNRPVMRNIDRFPEEYCFQLNEEEFKSLRCQIGTLKSGRGEHRKYLPYVFTEYGITMLAGILNNEIYFNGQIYDAYSKLLDLMIEAKNELIIIDNYADKSVLDMIRRLKVKVLLITKKNSSITKEDIEKYNKQYDNLRVVYNNTFHDRYLILDKKIVYHLGTSINYAGSKIFSINKIEDKDVIKLLIEKVDDIFSC